MVRQLIGQSRWSLNQYSRHHDAPLSSRIAKMSDNKVNAADTQQEMLANLKLTRERYVPAEKLEQEESGEWRRPKARGHMPPAERARVKDPFATVG